LRRPELSRSRSYKQKLDVPAQWIAIGISEKVALDFAVLPNFAGSTWLAKLFTDGWRMDYRSPHVWNVYAVCEDALKRN
jgi:hypothetical protein